MSASLEWPSKRRITVNLAPAALRKEGSGFDLPISLAVLAATRQVPPEKLAEHAAVGELEPVFNTNNQPNGFVAVGGNDSGNSSTFTVHVLCFVG